MVHRRYPVLTLPARPFLDLPTPCSQDDTLDVTTCKVIRQEAPEMVLAVRKVVKEGQVQVRSRGGTGMWMVKEGQVQVRSRGGKGERGI